MSYTTAQQHNRNYQLLQCAQDDDLVGASECIHAGANVNAVDGQSGLSALHYAVMVTNIAIVKFLLDRPNILVMHIDSRNTRRLSPMHIAIKKGSLKTAKMLYYYESRLMDMKDHTGATCLMISISMFIPETIFDWIWDLQVNRGIADNRLITPLMRCIPADVHQGKAIRMIESGEDVNEPKDYISVNGPMRIAIARKKLKLAKMLISADAKVEFKVPIRLANFQLGIVTSWVTHEVEGENLATIALQNATLQEEESLYIAYLVLIACSSPPSEDSIVQFYAKFFLASSPELHEGTDQDQQRKRHRLVEILCLALANNNQKIENEAELRQKYAMDKEAVNRIVEMYERISLKRLAVISARKGFLVMGYKNVMQALQKENLNSLERELIGLEWAFPEYNELLQQIKLINPLH